MPPSPCGRPSSWLTSSANHLVRLEEHRRGNGAAKGLGSLQVDDQLKFRGLLHGQVGGFGTFEDLVHIGGGTPLEVRCARRIGHEATGLHKWPYLVHGRQVACGREFGEPSTVLKEYGVPQDKERTRVRIGHGCEGAVKRLGTTRLHAVQ